MEVLKPKDNLSFEIGDVTFYVRPQMTVKDKFELDILGDYKDGQFIISKGDVFHKLVELFVVGWSGVTEDGKPIPYSYKTFMERIPGDIGNDWILRLGTFICDAIKLIPKASESPKGNG